MFMQVFLSAFLLVSSAGAVIRWPFSSDNRPEGWGVFLDVQIGTPSQQVKLKLSQDTTKTYLGVPTIHNFYGGAFDPSASSTFKGLSNINKDGVLGVSGTDNFVINGVAVENMPLNVYDQGIYFDGNGSVSLAFSGDTGSSFIQTLLKTQQEPIAVISYDKVEYYEESDQISGTLTLGGQASECSQQWTHFKEVPGRNSDVSWAFKADLLTVGKYQKRNPGIIEFYFHETQFTVPENMYDTIQRAIGADGDYFIPCDADTKIVLSAAGTDFVIGPETYRSSPTLNKKCLFEAAQFDGDAVNYYQLPIGVLKDICISYNYQTREVGLAPKLK